MSDDKTVLWHEAEGPTRCTEPSDYYEFAETDDPRVLAVIERDPWGQLSELFDGDAINPIYYREYRFGRSLTFVGGYDDLPVANAWLDARDRTPHRRVERSRYVDYRPVVDPDEFADRFVRIFHGAHVTRTSGGYNPDGEYLVFDTPEYREHIGDDPANVSAEAVEGIASEVRKALDGEVYGIGWAVNEARRLPDDEPIDLLDDSWVIDIQCWGYIGEDYAKASALKFEAGEPSLPEMLEVTA